MIILADGPLPPEEVLGREDLVAESEALGSRAGQIHVGGVSFGRVSVGVLGRTDRGSVGERTLLLARCPFSVDDVAEGHRYLSLTLSVELAEPDAVAHSLWPALVINDDDADRARTFVVGDDFTLTSAAALSAVGIRSPLVRYVDLRPSIAASGLGQSRFSWRYRPVTDQPLTPTSHTVFAVLDLPKDTTTVIGTISAGVETGRTVFGVFERLRSHTRCRPFSETVSSDGPFDHTSRPLVPAGVDATTVFISYAHDSDDHIRHVARFARFLALEGFNVIFDQWSDSQRRDWPAWATEAITRSDFVIAVVSPAYGRAADGIDPATAGCRGVQMETALLRELQYRDRGEWTKRLLPVVLPGHELTDAPLFLQPYSASHYIVQELSGAGAATLLRVLRGHPTQSPPASDHWDWSKE